MLNNNQSAIFSKILIFVFLILNTEVCSYSQGAQASVSKKLCYSDYMKRVINGNLEYISEKYNLSIAEAKIEAARVFQDPSLTFDWSHNNEKGAGVNYSLSAGLTKTIQTGQKRKARINLAKDEHAMTRAVVNDYLRNLVADATLDYLTALKQDFLYKVMLSSYQTMKELSQADSIRLSLGSIKAIDATQSRIEAGILLNDLLQTDADRRSSYLNLATRISRSEPDTLYLPAGNFSASEHPLILNELMNDAMNNRADLMAAKANVSVQKSLLTSIKSERRADIDLNAGTSNSYLAKGFSSPTAVEIYAGVAIPLKFSNFNKGELKIAGYQIEQGELLYQQSEVRIKNEVLQAFTRYNSLILQVENYDNGLLEQAKIVLNGKVYSYSRGETSLLEVLNAQRTYNDVQTAYYETLFSCIAALTELERSTGNNTVDTELVTDCR
jgi:outer membrane protein, heavy metal efflux system